MHHPIFGLRYPDNTVFMDGDHVDISLYHWSIRDKGAIIRKGPGIWVDSKYRNWCKKAIVCIVLPICSSNNKIAVYINIYTTSIEWYARICMLYKRMPSLFT